MHGNELLNERLCCIRQMNLVDGISFIGINAIGARKLLFFKVGMCKESTSCTNMHSEAI